MYKLVKDEKTTEIVGVLKNSVIGIPLDDANTDYQEYLKWLADGGVPEPADQPE